MTVLTRSDADKLIQEQGGNIIIPDTFTSIESDAFRDRRILSVVIPDSVTSIGNSAFERNRLLTSVVIGNGVTTIGDFAFQVNQLTSIVIPDSVTTIGRFAFQQNQLNSVVVGSRVKVIEFGAFSINPIKNIFIPDSVITLEVNAFTDTLIKSVTVPIARQKDAFRAFDVGVEITTREPGIVESSVSVRLDKENNNIVLIGDAAINGIGNGRANIIEGNDSRNKLKGRNGKDILTGNRGKDVLTGGKGDDTFVYRSIKDSGTKGKSRDVITDFTKGDAIDLRDIDAQPVVQGNQSFVFIGSDSFSRPGQVNFVNGLLSVNTDSDPAAELQIMLKNVTELFDGSLIL